MSQEQKKARNKKYREKDNYKKAKKEQNKRNRKQGGAENSPQTGQLSSLWQSPSMPWLSERVVAILKGFVPKLFPAIVDWIHIVIEEELAVNFKDRFRL
jgi:hypothetical protein